MQIAHVMTTDCDRRRRAEISGPFSGPSGHFGQSETRYLSEFSLRYRVFLEPPVGIEPTTYSLRVNRSAD